MKLEDVAIQDDFEHAQWVCDKLKVPLLQVNFVKEYWNSVFRYIFLYAFL